MSEPSFEVSERARALRNPAKTGPLVYYPSGWGTGHTERSAGPTMVGPADRSQPPPWSARLSFPAFSFPFLRSFLSSSFPSLPFLSLPPPPGHCFPGDMYAWPLLEGSGDMYRSRHCRERYMSPEPSRKWVPSTFIPFLSCAALFLSLSFPFPGPGGWVEWGGVGGGATGGGALCPGGRSEFGPWAELRIVGQIQGHSFSIPSFPFLPPPLPSSRNFASLGETSPP